MYSERNCTPWVLIATPESPYLINITKEPNVLEVGYNNKNDIPKGEKKMRKAKRGW